MATNVFPFFNTHHSPVGAFASFTVGFPGANGGWGLELGGPAKESIYLGLEAEDGTHFCAFPFFAGGEDETKRYVQEDQGDPTKKKKGPPVQIVPFPRESLTRDFDLASDVWHGPEMTWKIYNAPYALPDPDGPEQDALRRRVLPALFMEVTVDNRSSARTRRAFFGGDFRDPVHKGREIYSLAAQGIAAVARGTQTGIATDHPAVTPTTHFTAEMLLAEKNLDRLHFGLGNTGLLQWDVPAGEQMTVRFVVGFYRDGQVTPGWPSTYFYTRYWSDLEAVLVEGLQNFDGYKADAEQADAWLATQTHLNADQRFQLAHAIRGYFGSTQFLQRDGKPVWCVNEGEYKMLNTFDLTVDHLFYELEQNPWVMRNVLDQFVERYSYTDEVFFPGQPEQTYPGGLSFTHDMGVNNNFSAPHRSAYERAAHTGCFSYMTHEQLVNWTLCAASYVEYANDTTWRDAQLKTFQACLESLLNRDHPDPAQRDGVMSLDSTKTEGGAEITTYDSLDTSLGQARRNTYLAVKSWASYLALEKIFRDTGDAARAATAADQAQRAARTIMAAANAEGIIPAVLEGEHPAVIIPIIEGLIFPRYTGRSDVLASDGPYADFLAALRRHLDAVLVPERCIFPQDGGWKLSSTSGNSWLSKIYLCQHIARSILGREWGADGAKADAAHVGWLMDERNAFFAWSDQCWAGKMVGSKYYPRGVTAILWTKEG